MSINNVFLFNFTKLCIIISPPNYLTCVNIINLTTVLSSYAVFNQCSIRDMEKITNFVE